MKNRQIEITRRKILGSVGAIGLAGAASGLGTSALFSDEESFENNTITAGELDLRVDWEEHYWNDLDLPEGVDAILVGGPNDVTEDQVGLPDPENPMVAVAEDDLGAFMNATSIEAFPDDDNDGIQDNLEWYDACEHFAQLDRDLDPANGYPAPEGLHAKRSDNDDTRLQDESPAPLVNLNDVKPGDFGELTLSFHLCDNPGYVWLQGDLVNASENGHTEPEGRVDSDDAVELLDEIQTLLWYDEDGDNVFEPGGESGGEVDVVLVLDRSGSMGFDNRNEEMRTAAKNLVDALNLGTDAAQVGVVSFATEERLDHALSTDASSVKGAIDGIGASGTTNIEGGVNGGEEELTGTDLSAEVTASGNHRSGADKVMVVLSDGVPNEDDDGDGSDDPVDEASRAKGNGIEIYTIGFGISSGSSTADTLEDMASSPDNAYLGGTGDLTSIFGQISQQIAGEEAFFRGSLRDLLDEVSSDDGIPLDGDRSTGFDELGGTDADPARDEFVNSTNNFVGLAWWLPRDVGNEVQSDSVGFDLGFYTEQSRNNDGSGPSTPAT